MDLGEKIREITVVPKVVPIPQRETHIEKPELQPENPAVPRTDTKES